MTSRLRAAVAAAVLTASGAVFAPQAAVAADAAATAHITIDNFGYSGTLHVRPGEHVVVTNHDGVDHTLTDKRTHLFDTGRITANGGTGSFTAPSHTGRYPFGCRFHPEMAGTLVVEDGSTLATSASASVARGAAHRLRTALTDTTTRTGVSGRRIVLQRRSANGSFSTVAHATTGSGGSASAVVHPTARTVYRWHFAGSTGHAAATSGLTTLTTHR